MSNAIKYLVYIESYSMVYRSSSFLHCPYYFMDHAKGWKVI